MHFEILVEDASGKAALKVLVPKIIGAEHTRMIRGYKGIGRIPPNLSAHKAKDATLLGNLPGLLRGYGRTFKKGKAVVIVVCDLDDRCLKAFRRELFKVLNACSRMRGFAWR